MSDAKCPKCDGCGKVATDDDQTPWSHWTSLPHASSAAVLMGLVKPVPCPDCGGTGKAAEPKGDWWCPSCKQALENHRKSKR